LIGGAADAPDIAGNRDKRSNQSFKKKHKKEKKRNEKDLRSATGLKIKLYMLITDRHPPTKKI
jgi:hypothetical protein